MAASRRSRRAADVDPLPGVRRRVRRNVRLDATAAAVDDQAHVVAGVVGFEHRSAQRAAGVDAHTLRADGQRAGRIGDQVRHPEEAGDRSADGPFEQRARFVVLHDAAFEHERDAVAELGGLGPVVGDDHGRDLSLALDVADDTAQRVAAVWVQRGERLVEQQQVGVAAEGAGHRDALLLAAGQALHAPLGEGGDPHLFEMYGGGMPGVAPGDAGGAQRERDVVEDVQVPEQSRLLKDHGETAPVG